MELVGKAVVGEDVAWMVLILFELVAQLDDKVIDGAIRWIGLDALNLVEDFVA